MNMKSLALFLLLLPTSAMADENSEGRSGVSVWLESRERERAEEEQRSKELWRDIDESLYRQQMIDEAQKSRRAMENIADELERIRTDEESR